MDPPELPARELIRAAAQPPPVLVPCLLLTTAPAVKVINRSAIAKKAETLYVNLQSLIRRVGEEKVGFVTLTFPDNCADAKEAQARYHSFHTHFLKPRGLETICVPERQERGAWHYHLATAFPWDIRSGFDFEAYRNWQCAKRDGDKRLEQKWERKWCRSANSALKKWWHDLRVAAPKYGFGRCQTIPIISNAAGLCRYMASYVTTAYANRLPCDKGLRTVRYSLKVRPANLKWSWAEGTGQRHRRGIQILGMIYQLDFDGLNRAFTTKFQHTMRRLIYTFGEHFHDVLPFVVRISENADRSSRVRFCKMLFDYLTKNEPFKI